MVTLYGLLGIMTCMLGIMTCIYFAALPKRARERTLGFLVIIILIIFYTSDYLYALAEFMYALFESISPAYFLLVGFWVLLTAIREEYSENQRKNDKFLIHCVEECEENVGIRKIKYNGRWCKHTIERNPAILETAFKKKRIKLILYLSKIIAEIPDDIFKDNFYSALFGENKELRNLMLQKITKRNSDSFFKPILHEAIQNNAQLNKNSGEGMEIVRYLLNQNYLIDQSDEFGRTPIYYAISNNQYEYFEMLLPKSNIYHIDASNGTLFHVAVASNNPKYYFELIKMGKDANKLKKLLTTKDKYNKSPLHYCVASCPDFDTQIQLIENLLPNYFPDDAMEQISQAVHLATYSNNHQLLDYLKKTMFESLNKPDTSFHYPIYYAVSGKAPEAVQFYFNAQNEFSYDLDTIFELFIYFLKGYSPYEENNSNDLTIFNLLIDNSKNLFKHPENTKKIISLMVQYLFDDLLSMLMNARLIPQEVIHQLDNELQTCIKEMNEKIISNSEDNEKYISMIKALIMSNCAISNELMMSVYPNVFEGFSNLPKFILDNPTKLRLYAAQLLHAQSNVQRMRVILVGKEEAGKTTLIKYIMNHNQLNSLEEKTLNDKGTQRQSTDGIDVNLWIPPNSSVCACFWDFAGQSLYYSTHQFFVSENALYVLVFDLRHPLSDCKIFIFHFFSPFFDIIIMYL